MAGQLRASGSSRIRKEGQAASKQSTVTASSKGKGRKPAQGNSRQQAIHIASTTDDEEEDEDEFEEVAIPTISAPVTPGGTISGPGTPATHATARTGATTPADLTAESGAEGYDGYDVDESDEDDGVIRVEIGGETPEQKAKRLAMALRKKPITSKDRAMRLEAHKIHLVALIANARLRNSWSNDTLLKCRLLSLLPHPLVTAFSIPPSRFPDRAQRSRLFFEALQSLVTWWSQSFFDISDPNQGVRTRPWDEVQEVIDKLPPLTRADLLPQALFDKPAGSEGSSSKEAEKAMDAKLAQYETGANGERLRTINSLMKRAVLQNGSRDVSAILFVSLCRACGLGTRLVVNLQAVPWRAEKVAPKKMSGETKGGRTVASRQGNGDDDDDEDSMEEVEIPDPASGTGGPGAVMDKIKAKKEKNAIRQAGRRRHQDPADVYRLKKPKAPPQTAGGVIKKTKPKLDMANQPPIMWAEVFSRADQRWVPVDPIRGTIRKKSQFEPASDNGPVRMAYVLALEEDGYAREVTLRYTKSFGAKTSKLRVPTKKDEPDWWEGLLGSLTRPYRLNRDELEDAELETSQVSEAMPLHLSGFKDHPIFVLERHLKREEVIQPKREVGRFRGEPVYRRANVHSCKTAENWMRVGRKVKHRQDPMKWVKQRAMTLNRRREVELAKQNGEEQMQGLYAEWQTEVYTPPAIKNGIIPQNAFGNIDLYAPTMLPPGATHLPYKGIAKVAKSLGISYAEACTGFEFKKQRAIPVITGIVVASENTELTMAAYKESAAAAEERERRKREEKALKRWAKLINGLRVRERLRDTYGGKDNLHENSHNPLADPTEPKERKTNAANVLANAQKEAGKKWAERQRTASKSPTPDLAAVKQEIEDAARQAASSNHNDVLGQVKEEDEDDDEMEQVPLEPPAGVEVRDFAQEEQQEHREAEGEEDADDESTDAEMDDFDHAPLPEDKPSLQEEPEMASTAEPSASAIAVKGASAKPKADSAIATPSANGRPRRQTRQPRPARNVSIDEERPPERVQPRRAARQAVKVVDNPYEESSEDEEKAYAPEDEDMLDEDDPAGVDGEQEEDELEEVAVPMADPEPVEPDEEERPFASPSEPERRDSSAKASEVETKPLRSIRLRIKQPVKVEEPEPASTGGRVTRSSKRKR